LNVHLPPLSDNERLKVQKGFKTELVCSKQTVTNSLRFEDTCMEVNEKVKIVITVASLVAATVLLVAEYRRRRHGRKQTSSPSSCYLHSETKPQFGFKRVLADNSYSGFKHMKKLDDVFSSSIEKPNNSHPYETEIAVLLENPRLDEVEFLRGECSLEMSGSYVWVETEYELKKLAETLAKEKVFGVDTEQHSLRSFLGFTALVQISTEEEDFLVDTIALHDAMSILRPVFSNPDICKVFHGADNDVLWLQRDFHIYVVNMFDTAKACEVLSKPQRSLAYLLETVCGVATNKLLQREDWRQRPLSEEMVQYARTDAHYLLYIADRLTAELTQRGTVSGACKGTMCMERLNASVSSSSSVPFQSLAPMVISPPSLPTPMTQRLQLQPGSSPRRTSLLRDLNPRPPPEPPDPPDRVPPHRCCSVFLRSSPNFMSIGTPVVLSGLKVSSTVLFSWESQTIKLVAFHARCITLAGPLPLRFRSVSQTLRSVHLNLSSSVVLRLEDPCHQPPQIYLLSQLLASDVGGNPLRRPALSHMFLNLATDVGGNPLRRPVLSHQKLARIHDESTRYVLSDQAIIALACKNPTTAEEVHHSIAQADLATESSPSLSLSNQSPSDVICSHLNDIYQMTRDNKLPKLDALLPLVLEKCLGTDGTCPVSVFNYSLLINFKTKLAVHSAPKQNEHKKNCKEFTRKSSRDLFVKKFSCKAPVYHNCRIYANDGRLLCYCDRKKLEWYMNRGLAKLVEDEPPAIMLLFEPKGRPEDEGNDFYIQTKKNICVGCGEGNHYLRYRIIPSCYRVHFPEHLKSHRSHDIVLLCVDCHEVAHAAAERYKKQVASEFGIPLFVRRVVDSKEAASSVECDESRGDVKDVGVSPLHLRTAAMALLRHGNRMPSSRREELLQTVKMYYGGRDISEEDLERALLIGLSPHERRKLERKKGVPLKYSAEVAHMNKQENSSNDTDANSFVSSSVGEHGEEAPGDSEKYMNEESSIVADDSGGDGNTSHQQNSKLSLLGHGPHGKQVVEYLLREHGEDGVRDFCQRWRQVFVDTVHPRHLPGGWNVSHSCLLYSFVNLCTLFTLTIWSFDLTLETIAYDLALPISKK
ncbi:hypothetical protein HID58_017842, partial [Brassica napus]